MNLSSFRVPGRTASRRVGQVTLEVTGALARAAVLALALTGCQPSELRLNQGGQWLPYEDIKASWERDAPGQLRVCGVRDVEERAVDGGSMLCLRLRFDEARLAEVKAPATLTLDGTAEVSTSPQAVSPPTWTAREGSAPGVEAAWMTLDCFAAPLAESVTQQVRGQVLLEENGAKELRGRVVLEVEGALGGVCGGGTEGAEVDVSFFVRR